LGLYYTFDMVVENGRFEWRQISFLKVFKNYHLTFLLPLTAIFAGFFLLYSKKIGWTIALIVTFLHAFLFLILSNKDEVLFIALGKALLIATILFCTLWVSSFIILLFKPFRLKYSATLKNFCVVSICVGIIILDKTILYLTS